MRGVSVGSRKRKHILISIFFPQLLSRVGGNNGVQGSRDESAENTHTIYSELRGDNVCSKQSSKDERAFCSFGKGRRRQTRFSRPSEDVVTKKREV